MNALRIFIRALALAVLLVPFPAVAADDGRGAHGPADCGGDMSPADRMHCENVQLDTADKALGRVYARLMEALDEDAGDMLAESQRAWSAYRDANFGIFSAAASARGQEGLVEQVHAMRLATEARVAELEQLEALLGAAGLLGACAGPAGPPPAAAAAGQPGAGTPEAAAQEPPAPAAPPVDVQSAEDLDLLLGDHPLRIQWLSSLGAGTVTARKRGDALLLTGRQGGNGDELALDGYVTSVRRDAFTFHGTLVTRIGFLNGGKPCARTGTMVFARKAGRPFWRLQSITNPCCGVSDYVDIHVRKARPGN